MDGSSADAGYLPQVLRASNRKDRDQSEELDGSSACKEKLTS